VNVQSLAEALGHVSGALGGATFFLRGRRWSAGDRPTMPRPVAVVSADQIVGDRSVFSTITAGSTATSCTRPRW